MKLEASSFHNPRSYWKLTWGQKTDRLTPTLEESPRVRQSENEASVSSTYPLFVGCPRWSRYPVVYTLSPHHPLRGLIQGYGKVTAPQSLYVVWAMGR